MFTGIVSDVGEVIDVEEKADGLRRLTIACGYDPETIDIGESTGQAAALMIHGGFRHLPVLDGGRPAGIVSIRDLMRVVVDDESPRGV